MSQLTLALVQSDISWEQPEKNLAHFDRLVGKGILADLVILPEMFTTGFSMASAALAEKMDGPAVSWMRDTAKSIDTALCGSLIIEQDGHYFNRFIWATADGACRHYDKRHLFRLSAENEHYTGGSNKLILELNGFRICPQICYDLRFPVWSRNDSDFDLLLYVANWPAVRRDHWNTLLRARAIENLCYVAAVNRIGVDGNDVEYCGDSTVIDFTGIQRAQMQSAGTIETISMDRQSLLAYRKRFPAHLDADKYKLSL
ncbi:MAG: amidohydrolase [Gammaproteobacteria bacterium]|jgi:predicted amidohydrolase|nr:amidohydrolase [Gammaproteobacteria bacterium]